MTSRCVEFTSMYLTALQSTKALKAMAQNHRSYGSELDTLDTAEKRGEEIVRAYDKHN